MAKNDIFILDGILDDREASKTPSARRDEVFEYLAIEQILKDQNLVQDDIYKGWIDGKDDGGVDGFYIFINGHLLDDAENFFWPKSNVEIEVYIITCKHHDTFKQAPLDNMVATLSEVLDFTIEKSNLKTDYNKGLIKYRELLKTAYRKLASRMGRFSIKFSYASRGDTASIGPSILSRSEQAKDVAQSFFVNCDAEFKFLGCTEIVALYRRKPNFSLELPYVKYLGQDQNFIVLTKLTDYNNFITDENGKLRKYLFDSNIRAFMGLNAVNDDIRATLENEHSPEFWWLNNGVTVLATSAIVVGNCIQIEDIQIVNGLQTTESIYNHFHSGQIDSQDRSVLVKVIVSNQADIRDSIIQATNNQTSVEISALHATDKIQRDIEDILSGCGLYYERRTNYYKNLSIPNNLIISPLYLASSRISLIDKNPFKASTLKQKFMRDQKSYEAVFTEKVSLPAWPVMAKLLKLCDETLERKRGSARGSTEGFLRLWRHLLALVSVSRIFGTFIFGDHKLSTFSISELTEQILDDTWAFFELVAKDISYHKPRKELFDFILSHSAAYYKIGGIEVLKISDTITKKDKLKFDESFLEKVNSLLPAQPWKIGFEEIVMENLACSRKHVHIAVQMLVKRGLRYKQKGGIMYNSDNKIIFVDPEKLGENIVLVKKD